VVPDYILSLGAAGMSEELRIIFCGSREWRDKNRILQIMRTIKLNLNDFIVIEGENGKRDKDGKVMVGADLLSRESAEELNLLVDPYPADWNKFKLAAGPIRNTQMLRSGAHATVALHHDLPSSKGTRNMVEQSLKAGLPVLLSTDNDEKFAAFIFELKRIKHGSK
jgi:hypothetical protein